MSEGVMRCTLRIARFPADIRPFQRYARTMERTNLEIPDSLLPKDMAIIASLVGMDNMLALAERYGGTRLRFPMTPRADHALLEILDTDSLQRLCFHFSGDRIHISKCERARTYLRNAAILAAYGPQSLAQLARANGLCERQISRIVAQAEQRRSKARPTSSGRSENTTRPHGLLSVARSLTGNTALE